MNLQPTPELSLYQLTQSGESLCQSLVVSATTFKSLVGTLINFLIEQRLGTAVWVKFPRNDHWLTEIERYQQQGIANLIYQCSTQKISSPPVESLSSRRYSSVTQIVPIQLEASSQLKREYFLGVLSPQFCGLILAQRQTPQGQRETQSQSSNLNLVYSFDPSLITRVLAGIKQAIAINDTTPETLLTGSDLPFALPSTPNTTLLTNLLLKQIQLTDSIHLTANVSSQAETTIKRLTESLRLQDEFLTSLVQEIRSPLTNMKTALHLLESKQIKREQRERYLGLLHQVCDRQNSLLTGLLEFVQLDQLSQSESDSSLKLEDLIPGIVSTYQPLAEEKGILLGYTVPPGFPPISCPNSWIRQIILNLLNNSLKFTPPKGRVFVQATLKNEYVELTVSDTGRGIESHDLPKIFNNFYRGQNINADQTPGTGLGLSVVKQLLQRCGGSISVTSKLSKGSTFTVLLPIN